MNDLTTEKTMTTKELADALGVSARTVQLTADKLFDPAKLISRVINGGKSWVFTEAQATAIKLELQNHSKVASNGFNTLDINSDLEMLMVQKKLSEYQDRRITELTMQVETLAPKAEVYELCCSSDNLHSIQDLGKNTGLGAHNIFKRLMVDGIIYEAWTDGQKYYRPYSEYDHYFKLTSYPYMRAGRNYTGHTLMLTSKGFLHFSKRYGVDK